MKGERSRWLILALVVLAQLMVVLDATIVNIALPTAQSALGFSNGSRQWIVTGYALAFGSLLPLGGRLGDVFGRRRALLVGSLGFAGASAFGGAAQSFEWLLAARVLQGAFGALLAPSGLALLTTTFTEPRDRNKAFGIFGAVVGSGAAVGLLLGGALTEYLSWRWCLYVNLFLALPVALGAMALVPSQKLAGKPSLDLPGALTAAGGLFLIVFGFDRAQIAGWSAAQTVASLVAGVALLGLFVVIELRSRQPLLPMRLLENRTRAGSYLAVLFAGVGTFGVFLFVTYYMQQTLGFSPLTSGLAFLPMIGTVIVTSVGVNALLLARLGPRPLVVAGMLLDAARARPPDAARGRLDLRGRHPAVADPRRRRPRPRLPDRHQHRDRPRGSGGERRRLLARERRPAGRRLARDGAAEHGRRQRDDRVPEHAPRRPESRRERDGARLHGRVLVVGGDLPARRARLRALLTGRPRPAPAEPVPVRRPSPGGRASTRSAVSG